MLIFAVLELGVLSIAATVWLEMRRAERRNRRARNVQAAVNDEIPLKRAA